MTTVRPLVFAVATALAFAAGSAVAAQADGGPAAAAQPSTSLTPQQRGELTRQFVMKWGVYVQNAYGTDVGTWAKRMGGTFATADAVNFQQALRRSTYEGAMATLDGAGHKLSDARVIDILAASDGSVMPNALGDLDKDLVFTAIEPCRIIDTRNAGGPIAAGAFRVFGIGGATSFSSSGGSATDCGMTTQRPKAIVVNLTAVAPAQTGFATLYPSLIATPNAASMIYQAGTTLSNAVTTQVATNDNVRIFSERTVHYVVDMVGYYDAPYATALQCQNVQTFTAVPAGSSAFNDAVCAAGYEMTGGGGFWVGSENRGPLFVFPSSGTQRYTVRGYNTSGSSTDLYTRARCCRVPGR